MPEKNSFDSNMNGTQSTVEPKQENEEVLKGSHIDLPQAYDGKVESEGDANE